MTGEKGCAGIISIFVSIFRVSLGFEVFFETFPLRIGSRYRISDQDVLSIANVA